MKKLRFLVCPAVPANHLGFQLLSLGHLKVMQQPLKLDYP